MVILLFCTNVQTVCCLVKPRVFEHVDLFPVSVDY